MAQYYQYGPFDLPEDWHRVEIPISSFGRDDVCLDGLRQWLADPDRPGAWYWWVLTDGYGVRTTLVVHLTQPLAFEFKMRWA